MQNIVANTILRRTTNVQGATIVSTSNFFPLADRKRDYFAFILAQSFSQVIFLMFIPIVYRSVYRIVYEKSTNTKETLKMMGMHEVSYWCSWWLYYTLLNTTLVSLAVTVLGISVFVLESLPTLWLLTWIYG